GTFTANAEAKWHFVDNDPNPNPASADVTRSTSGNSGPGGSGPAVKRFVDANVSITPNGVNEVGTAHTFTVSTTADPQGTTARLLSITPNVNPEAPLLNNNCANSANGGGSGNTRTCTFQINSTPAGTSTATADVSWKFDDSAPGANPASVTVNRSTDE